MVAIEQYVRGAVLCQNRVIAIEDRRSLTADGLASCQVFAQGQANISIEFPTAPFTLATPALHAIYGRSLYIYAPYEHEIVFVPRVSLHSVCFTHSTLSHNTPAYIISFPFTNRKRSTLRPIGLDGRR